MFKKISNSLFVVILLFLSFCSIKIVIDKINNDIPSLFGYYVFEISSSSMDPTFSIGDKILVKKIGLDEIISIDEIITFYVDDNIVTHRVVDVIYEDDNFVGYSTKGDSIYNSIDYWTIEQADIIGVFKYQIT